ncbi:MAG: family 20 glycosylhydrolase [Planctomycetota bacterium]
MDRRKRGGMRPVGKREREGYLLPRPQEIAWLDKAPFGRPKSVEIVVLEPAGKTVRSTAMRAAAAFRTLLGVKASVVLVEECPAPGTAKAARVVFGKAEGAFLNACGEKGLDLEKLEKEESYFLWAGPGMALVAAPNDIGLVYGGSTLIQLLRIGACARTPALPGVLVHDWPELEKYRVFTQDIADTRGALDHIPRFWEWQTDIYSAGKISHLGLYLEGWFDFKCLPMAFRPKARPLNAKSARAFSEYAWNRGVRVFPLTNFMAHSDLFGKSLEEAHKKNKKEFRWISRCRPFCPTSQESGALADKIVGELAEGFPHSEFVHIGGDEVARYAAPKCPGCRRLEEDRRAAAGSSRHIGDARWVFRYVEMLNQLSTVVKRHGRAAAFWADCHILLSHPKALPALDKDLVAWVWAEMAPEFVVDGFDFRPKVLRDHGCRVWNSRSWWIPEVVPFEDRRGTIRSDVKRSVSEPGVEANNATAWGDRSAAGYYLFDTYSNVARLDGLWSTKGGGPESFDRAFALQILGINDSGAARTIRDMPHRLCRHVRDASGDALEEVVKAKEGLAPFAGIYAKKKETIQKLRGKWKIYEADIQTLAALEKRVADKRARIYIYCLQGQARQLQHAARFWDVLMSVSKLYGRARAAKGAIVRGERLVAAGRQVDALLPFYGFLEKLHKRCIKETGLRPDHGDVRVRFPFKMRDDLEKLSGELKAMARGGELPAPEKLHLFKSV